MGDIGTDEEEVEFLPLQDPEREPAPVAVPVETPEPVKRPEGVPA